MIEHEKCGRCGRDLKSAKSKKDGYGSKCKKKMLEAKNAVVSDEDKKVLQFLAELESADIDDDFDEVISNIDKLRTDENN